MQKGSLETPDLILEVMNLPRGQIRLSLGQGNPDVPRAAWNPPKTMKPLLS
jgi:hypothetical protein